LTARIKVAYIAGDGRSGSTLLERMLGQVDDCVAVGELRHIWERSFGENHPCGCGVAFRECEFWRAVVEEAFGGFDNIGVGHVKAIKNAVDRVRYIPRLLLPLRTARFERDLKEYQGTLEKLYRGIQSVSTKEIIVDSSKDLSSIFLLATMAPIHISVVHLVRDSRAVAYSWSRKKVWLESEGKKLYFPTRTPGRSAMEWTFRNCVVALSRYFGISYTRVRYEDLIGDPVKVLTQVLRRLGKEMKGLDALDGKTLRLSKENHTVSGNPVRFRQGRIELRPDMEWMDEMKSRDKRLVTILTLPLLRRYGYSLKGA
jgi:hypothetical protein